MDHYGHKVHLIVTPKDCSRCHPTEFKQYEGSRHAKAASYVEPDENILGEIVGGVPAANSGCAQCHGSKVKVLADGSLDPQTWPNTGVGRVNPDGSLGACTACHPRHSFSLAVARSPESCGRCHLGPDHPQSEIYAESVHGVLFASHRQDSDLNAAGGAWLPGRNYHYPTCATCHMSATSDEPVTHDTGTRLSWDLHSAISVKRANFDDGRGQMQQVCGACHAPTQVMGHYTQFDAVVNLYNDKFGKPSAAIMDQLAKDGKITSTPYDAKIKWTYFRMWHNAGRTARMGAAMMGPDYTWWKGMFELASGFYNDFIPEAEQLEPGITEPVMDSPFNQWHKGLTPEQVQQTLQFYQQRASK
jgi:hypothetical protein